MANAQVSRLAYRQDQVLQLPFPTTPNLADQIQEGVLKQRGAANYDQQLRHWVEQIQNVIKLSLRWPQLEQWQQQLESLTTIQSSVASALATLSQFQLSLAQLSSTSASHSAEIAALQVSVANLIAAVNLFNQYTFTQISPTNPWTIVHGRPVRPGGIHVMSTPDYREVLMFQSDDSTIGTTILTFGYNLAGVAVLPFS